MPEFFRCLRVLQALQNESEAIRVPAPSLAEEHGAPPALRNEPKVRGNPGDPGQPGERAPAQPAPPAWGAPWPPTPQGGLADLPVPTVAGGASSLLAGTALVPAGFRTTSEQATWGLP